MSKAKNNAEKIDKVSQEAVQGANSPAKNLVPSSEDIYVIASFVYELITKYILLQKISENMGND